MRRRGDPATAADILEVCLAELHAAPYELLTTTPNIALARALEESGRAERATRLVEEAILAVQINGDLCYLPALSELVRA